MHTSTMDTKPTKGSPSGLVALREEMGLTCAASHQPTWVIERADDRFTWLMDGDRAVALLDEAEDNFELRCHGPDGPCPPAAIPKHYHIVSYEGLRAITTWRLGGKDCGERIASDTTIDTLDGNPHVHVIQRWSNGTISEVDIVLRFDPAWNAYVADATASLKARRATTALEFCNLIPAGIGDTRPGRERFPFTFWQHPDGLRKMLKNPLWFCSVGAQDLAGEKRLADSGFLGFGPDERLNPVIEIVAGNVPVGATTCDNLQDEHIMVAPAEGRHAAASGWVLFDISYRLFSIPEAMAEQIVYRADLMDPGAMVAWKFQYPPTPELPDDLSEVELPGSPYYGAADWSRPVPWDRPYDGVLWTASPDPAAAIHYDRTTGRTAPGAIRLRVSDEAMSFSPGSGHTLHTEAGKTYRFGAWVKTLGETDAWVEIWETRFRPGDTGIHSSPRASATSDWTYVEAELTARGDDAPFAVTALRAEGPGDAWFCDPVFEAMS